MDEHVPFVDVFPIENRDFPASHVSLLEGNCFQNLKYDVGGWGGFLIAKVSDPSSVPCNHSSSPFAFEGIRESLSWHF